MFSLSSLLQHNESVLFNDISYLSKTFQKAFILSSFFFWLVFLKSSTYRAFLNLFQYLHSYHCVHIHTFVHTT